MTVLLFVLHLLSMFVIATLGLAQLHLAWACIKRSSKHTDKKDPLLADELAQYCPFITVQLPIYNERYVVERLLRHVAAFDYPSHCWEVQILDDSTDDTTATIRRLLKKWPHEKVSVHHMRRPERIGFKAGALQYGLERAKGECLAIFDADFTPPANFLKAIAPYFKDPKLGFVQTRWGYLNRTQTLLTRLQAFALDAHFLIEQNGRSHLGLCTNFNGTAGIWRKACILDAGGWKSDTLTEDLDLSYRAQFKQWTYRYVPTMVSPSELPNHMMSIKAQQYRWNKGAAQASVKLLPLLLKSELSPLQKIHSFLHLISSSVMVFVFISSLLSVPILYVKTLLPQPSIFDIGSIFLLSFFGFCFFYASTVYVANPPRPFAYYFFHFPLFLAFSLGMSLYNSWAVIEGWIGIKTSFTRTPKEGQNAEKRNTYLRYRIHPTTCMEIIMAAYYAGAIGLAFYLSDFALLFFHLLSFIGYFCLLYYTFVPMFKARFSGNSWPQPPIHTKAKKAKIAPL